VFLLNGRRELSWQAARLDYWRWHGIENQELFPGLDGVLFLWESKDGSIASALNPEAPGEVYLQVHPGFRTPELEEEMIALAEQRLAVPIEGGARRLRIWAHQGDELRGAMLRRRGYTPGDWPEHQRQRSLEAPLPQAQPAPGYTLRSLGDEREIPARSWLSWRAFHPSEPDEAYEGHAWYANIQRCPLYRRDLDLVAAAPGGELAGFCTLWYDDATRTGYFEPVGVDPAHQQRGLGKALMLEAMRRLQRLGGVLATVAGFGEAANALYGAVMSPEYTLFEPWVKPVP
jgi:ribosomal protein S18 acetylase RimI-like enzyme